MNELFCFHEDLTEIEIQMFMNEVAQICQKQGFEAGLAVAKKKLQEYPNSDSLLLTMTSYLKGMTMLSDMTTEQKQEYEQLWISWYEKLLHSEDEKICTQARFMVASHYLNEGDYEKAQELVNEISEATPFYKRMLQTNLYMKQEQFAEAKKYVQKNLLESVNEVYNMLMKLVDIELELGHTQNASYIAEIVKKATHLFELWEYNAYVPQFQVAVLQKQEKETLDLLEQMLEALSMPWDFRQTVLYESIASDEQSLIGVKMMQPLLQELKTEPAYAFLHGNERFEKIIAKY